MSTDCVSSDKKPIVLTTIHRQVVVVVSFPSGLAAVTVFVLTKRQWLRFQYFGAQEQFPNSVLSDIAILRGYLYRIFTIMALDTLIPDCWFLIRQSRPKDRTERRPETISGPSGTVQYLYIEFWWFTCISTAYIQQWINCWQLLYT